MVPLLLKNVEYNIREQMVAVLACGYLCLADSLLVVQGDRTALHPGECVTLQGGVMVPLLLKNVEYNIREQMVAVLACGYLCLADSLLVVQGDRTALHPGECVTLQGGVMVPLLLKNVEYNIREQMVAVLACGYLCLADSLLVVQGDRTALHPAPHTELALKPHYVEILFTLY
ncbi:hypothetical protein J6590_022453 [Homalodisca vitripennis]|nr:hypothetical protein J6590_022453 [Homalodisca vitripennis]